MWTICTSITYKFETAGRNKSVPKWCTLVERLHKQIVSVRCLFKNGLSLIFYGFYTPHPTRCISAKAIPVPQWFSNHIYSYTWFTTPKRKVVLRICSFVHHLSVAIVQLEVAKYSHFQYFLLPSSVDLNKIDTIVYNDRTSNTLTKLRPSQEWQQQKNNRKKVAWIKRPELQWLFIS